MPGLTPEDRQKLDRAVAEIRKAFENVPEDELEREIEKAVRAARAELRAEAAAVSRAG
jgi:hypothetical protein